MLMFILFFKFSKDSVRVDKEMTIIIIIIVCANPTFIDKYQLGHDQCSVTSFPMNEVLWSNW